MWKFCSCFAVLSLLAPLAFAEDEVRFFDGYKYGWKTVSHLISVSKEGDVIYTGFEKENNKRRTEKHFNISAWKIIDAFISIGYEKEGELFEKDAISFLSDRMFYGFLSSGGFDLVFNFYHNTDERLMLIKTNKRKKYRTLGAEQSEYFIDSYFEYRATVQILKNKDLLIASEKVPYFFIIPQSKLHWVIARENLFYAPMRYVTTIWKKTPACPPIPFKEEVPPIEIDKCLEAIFKSQPKGEYNVDFPDTPDYDAFTR
jgi:hypothetical protein